MMASSSDSIFDIPRNERHHAFRTLQAALTPDQPKAEDFKDVFKPLFQSRHQVQGELEVAPIPSESKEEIRNKGFETGFAAGRQDACAIIEQEIAPSIKDFVHEYKQLSENLRRLEQNESADALKIALAVAMKITGSSPQLTLQDLDCLKDGLKESMSRACTLKLVLNDEDLNNLSHFAECQVPQWKTSPSIQIEADPAVKRGTIKTIQCDRPVSPMEKIIPSLERLLAKVSTK